MEHSPNNYRKNIIKNHKNLKIKRYLEGWDYKMLKKKGIPKEILPACTRGASFDALGVHYHGIAFQNNHGGWLIYEDSILFDELTIGKNGMVYIPFKDGFKASTCCVFTSVMDYLSFLTIQYYKPKEQFLFSDCYILGDATVFLSCAEYSTQYDNIFCLFPYDDLGRMMYMTLKDVATNSVVQDNDAYKDCESLQNYLDIWKKKNKWEFKMV